MPLSTGALWPTLRPLGTAAAADMTSKFEWLEGNILPQSGGALTASAYDIGSASYKWANGHFTNIDLATATFTAAMVGKKLKAWGSFNVTGATLTTLESYKVSSISYSPAFPGQYQFVITAWGHSAGAFTPVAAITTPRDGNNVITNPNTRVSVAIHNFEIDARSASNVHTDSSFSFIAAAFLP